MEYCPIGAWKKAKDKGLSPYEQVVVGKEVSKKIKACNCSDKK